MRRRWKRRQAGQVIALMVILTGVLGLVGGGLIDVAGAIQYDEFLLRVADSGAHAASSQSTAASDGTIGVDASAGQSLAGAILNPWIGVNGISAASVSISGGEATATVNGVYHPLVLGGMPGFRGFSLTAIRTESALPTG